MDDDENDDRYPSVFEDGLALSAENRAAPRSAGADQQLLDLPSADRQRLLELTGEERVVSARRRTLHARIDFLGGQGSADHVVAEQLEYLRSKERPLSDRRKEIHREIALLRARAAGAP